MILGMHRTRLHVDRAAIRQSLGDKAQVAAKLHSVQCPDGRVDATGTVTRTNSKCRHSIRVSGSRAGGILCILKVYVRQDIQGSELKVWNLLCTVFIV